MPAATPTAMDDNGAADEIHGESGDDSSTAMVGNDVMFGEGQDDDLIGGWGNDWISGGTGDDGILGDDGRIYHQPQHGRRASRSTASPACHAGQARPSTISTPGNIQTGDDQRHRTS